MSHDSTSGGTTFSIFYFSLFFSLFLSLPLSGTPLAVALEVVAVELSLPLLFARALVQVADAGVLHVT